MASSASVVDSLAPAVHLLLRWLLAFGYVITPSSPVLIVASLREFSRVDRSLLLLIPLSHHLLF
ncbi:unnamed protein product [Brassica rapa subsp. trilocularis]|uniref:(rape) hypothetical protein n=1 Tax=Brassica napus TaxID=3708 RepID=A0A816YVW9_BRANA|nr:unnamed protein product [Brassica napus]